MHANAAPRSLNPASAPHGPPVLLYDGRCGLCARCVQFVLRHEHASPAAPAAQARHPLHFATLQGAHGARALASHRELEGVDSVVWIEPSTDRRDRVLLRSDAVLAVLDHLGGGWSWLARIGRLVPKVSRDALYRVVARYRYRVFGRSQSCLMPMPEQRKRFLD